VERPLRLIGQVAAEAGARAWLVGGPVRDLLLGGCPPDLDIAIEGPVEAVAQALAEHLQGRVQKTTRFLTATVVLADDFEIDVARARTETYPEPGVLPVVAAAGIEDDLRRRDFTVNAMALALAPGEFGELLDPHGGMADLQARLLRVLHDASFEDDPTRMIRAARFMLRLSFELEEHTRELLERAVAQRRPAAVSGARVRNELRLLFAAAPARALSMLADLGFFEGMGLAPASRRAIDACGRAPEAMHALGLDCEDVEWMALCLGIYAALSGQDPEALAERLMLDGDERAALRAAAEMVAHPPEALLTQVRDSELFEALEPRSPSALIACRTVLDRDAVARLERYWRDLRGTRADITGEDLKAAGHEPGSAFGEALRAALAAKLDAGAGRDEQLRIALGVLEASAPGDST